MNMTGNAAQSIVAASRLCYVHESASNGELSLPVTTLTLTVKGPSRLMPNHTRNLSARKPLVREVRQ